LKQKKLPLIRDRRLISVHLAEVKSEFDSNLKDSKPLILNLITIYNKPKKLVNLTLKLVANKRERLK
jgi:hypothetical protein